MRLLRRRAIQGLEPLDPVEFLDAARAIERQVAEVIVGQTEAVRGMLICLTAGGHALLEGVPGLGKTTLARAFAASLGLPTRGSSSRQI